jgi:hypothetical protein
MLWRGGECVDEIVAEAADDANAAAAGDDDNNNQNLTAPSVLTQHSSRPPSRQTNIVQVYDHVKRHDFRRCSSGQNVHPRRSKKTNNDSKIFVQFRLFTFK